MKEEKTNTVGLSKVNVSWVLREGGSRRLLSMQFCKILSSIGSLGNKERKKYFGQTDGWTEKHTAVQSYGHTKQTVFE